MIEKNNNKYQNIKSPSHDINVEHNEQNHSIQIGFKSGTI